MKTTTAAGKTLELIPGSSILHYVDGVLVDVAFSTSNHDLGASFINDQRAAHERARLLGVQTSEDWKWFL